MTKVYLVTSAWDEKPKALFLDKAEAEAYADDLNRCHSGNPCEVVERRLGRPNAKRPRWSWFVTQHYWDDRPTEVTEGWTMALESETGEVEYNSPGGPRCWSYVSEAHARELLAKAKKKAEKMDRTSEGIL